MPTRKRTLRTLPPVTRRLARLCNDLESVKRRLKNLCGDILLVESSDIAQARQLKSIWEAKATQQAKEKGAPNED